QETLRSVIPMAAACFSISFFSSMIMVGRLVRPVCLAIRRSTACAGSATANDKASNTLTNLLVSPFIVSSLWRFVRLFLLESAGCACRLLLVIHHPPLAQGARFDRAEDQVLDYQSDENHREQAGEHIRDVHQVLVFVDEPAKAALP